jgi:ABC-2 type transport system permease protein
MSAALAISKREIRHYFNSPVPYVVATVFLLVAGFLCFSTLFIERQADLRGFFSSILLWFLPILLPAVTMRLLAEEKGSGSLELLITMPVRDWEVVVGKYLAALVFVAVLVGLTVVYAISVSFIGPLDKGATASGYIGLFMLGAAYAAIGLMASAFTKNQIVAFIVGFGICFSLFLVGKLTQIVPPSLQPVTSFLGTDSHFESFTRGVIDSRDLIYYLSLIGVSLVVATVAIAARKWK